MHSENVTGGPDDPQRRHWMKTAAIAGAALGSGCVAADESAVDDISGLNSTSVRRLSRPTTTEQVRQLLVSGDGVVSVGGGRFSMGGQIVAPDSLHLDIRALDGLVWLDAAARRVRVQAGMRWRELQDRVDPHDLSVKIMQSYSNFSVGGSLSVNCHGRYVGTGPVINSVRALQLVDAAGVVRELSREENADLFHAVIGGYGGLGVITEVELDLASNDVMQRQAQRVALADYPAFFHEQVLGNPDVLMHNADLAAPTFDQPLAISWLRSDAALTEPQRLTPRNLRYSRERSLLWAVSELPVSSQLRERYKDDLMLSTQAVVRRNFEASLDTAMLEPRTRMFSTYLLQEYFVPVAACVAFVRELSRILQRHRVNALNVSIRHSPAETGSLLGWAKTDVFCFVLYYKQRTSDAADIAAQGWARELIDAALALGGRYYLPYRLHATQEQFLRAYPAATEFARIKRMLDPRNRFRSLFWDRYLPV